MLNDVILIGVLEDINFINVNKEVFQILNISYKVAWNDLTSSNIEVLINEKIKNKLDSNVILGTLVGVQGFLAKLKNKKTYLIAEEVKYFN